MRTLTLIGLMIYLNTVFAAQPVEEYRFERYLPVLQQPWYFGDASDIAVDSKNHVYIFDEENVRLQKFTMNGLLMKSFSVKHEGYGMTAITIDKADNIYVLYRSWDGPKSFIVKFDAQGNEDNSWKIQVFEDTLLSDIVVDSHGYLYATDRWRRSIHRFEPDGIEQPNWGENALEEMIVATEPNDLRKELGIAIDSDENIYILVDMEKDNGWICKNKFNNSNLTTAEKCWGKFYRPRNIAVDKHNHLYITDSYNNRILKYDANGKKLDEWTHKTEGDVEQWKQTFLSSPLIDGSLENPVLFKLIQQFMVRYIQNEESRTILEEVVKAMTDLIKRLLLLFPKADATVLPSGIAVDKTGEFVFVSQYYPHNSIKKLANKGKLLAIWSSNGQPGEDRFYTPTKVAIDNNGGFYVTDVLNHKIVKFDHKGQFITQWGNLGSAPGEFIFPLGMAIDTDSQNNTIIYVVDVGNLRIQKFTDKGTLLDIWSLELGLKTKTNEFILPLAIAVDKHHDVYVVDGIQGKIKKFDAKGRFKMAFGNGPGTQDGEFNFAAGITIDRNDNIYVADFQNHRIQQFDSQGNFITKFGHRNKQSLEKGILEDPIDVATDEKGDVYVADSDNHRIQKFKADCIHEGKLSITEDQSYDPTCIVTFGSRGVSPGQFSNVSSIAVTPNGNRVYAVDWYNHRVQIFNNARFDSGKAIIVAGRSSERDNLWDATQAIANFAYHVLLYQGFKKDEICYLSPDIGSDIDGDGIKDIDGAPTLDNVQKAILWAGNESDGRCDLTSDAVLGMPSSSPKQKNAANLTLYMVDHGGNGADGKGVFHLNEKETLSSTDLNHWLNAQAFNKAKIIYDACRSGHFLEHLKSDAGNPWLVISSAAKNQDAYFDSQGSLSFSYFFWSYIFNGLSVGEAFQQTTQAIEQRFNANKQQTPQLNANGDGNFNDNDDYQVANEERIGNAITIGTPIDPNPQIGPTITIENTELDYNGTGPINITVAVTDDDGVNDVWATVHSPTTLRLASRGNPFIKIPQFQLTPTEAHRYERGYSDFTRTGMYEISVYAQDGLGNVSQPQVIRVNVSKPAKHRALIIAGADANPDNLQAAINALKSKGIESHEDEDELVTLFSDNAIADVDIIHQLLQTFIDEPEFYLNTRFKNDTRSLVLYIEGTKNYGDSFEFGSEQRLSFATLDRHLDELQKRLPNLEMVTVIYEGQYAGDLLPSLTPPTDKQRIVITSTDNSYANACYQNQSSISFSKLFWQEISQGSNIQDAFKRIKEAVKEIALKPQLDDNGDGIYEIVETKQGEYQIGETIIRANIAPVINQVKVSELELAEKTQATLIATITTTEPLKKVGAIICAPNQESEHIELQPDEEGKYWTTTYDKFVMPGHYLIHVYAKDIEGRVSFPSERTRTAINKGPSFLMPNQEQYHNGEAVLITRPQIPESHVQYMAIQLPDGRLFTINDLNHFQPFNAEKPLPKWEGTNNTVIDYQVTKDLPRGEYHLHLVILPKEEELKFPLEQNTWGESVFYLE